MKKIVKVGRVPPVCEDLFMEITGRRLCRCLDQGIRKFSPKGKLDETSRVIFLIFLTFQNFHPTQEYFWRILKLFGYVCFFTPKRQQKIIIGHILFIDSVLFFQNGKVGSVRKV